MHVVNFKFNVKIRISPTHPNPAGQIFSDPQLWHYQMLHPNWSIQII